MKTPATTPEGERQAKALLHNLQYGLLGDALNNVKSAAVEQWIASERLEQREVCWLRFQAVNTLEIELMATLHSMIPGQRQDIDDDAN